MLSGKWLRIAPDMGLTARGEQGQQILIDLEALNDVTTDFLSFLVRVRQEACKNAQTVHLIGVNGKLRRVLEETGLARFFTFEISE